MTRLNLASTTLFSSFCALCFAVPASALASWDGDWDLDWGRGGGVVYTMSNAANGNSVIAYRRAPTGELTFVAATPTGGTGAGTGLGNAGAVVLSPNGRWLFVVNPGSNDFTVFEASRSGLVARAKVPSRGVRPVSITVDNDLIYVLNAGSDSIAGFRIAGDGIKPLSASVRPLSGTGVGAAEIAFSPDGNNLVVTEKTTNKIDVFNLGEDGLPAAARPNVFASQGVDPFGFTFDQAQTLLVTEAAPGVANGSSISSYRLTKDGALSVIQAAAPTQQSAACWVATTPGGRYAYTTDAASGVISGFSVGRDGKLTLLNADGVAANPGAGSTPIDTGVGGEGRFLYTLNAGAHTITAFSIAADGSLSPIAAPYGGLPSAANGLAVR
jgi:6-phosphogluconolactonase